MQFLNDPVGFIRDLLLVLPGVIIAISFHEFGHAWMADRLGDPTPRNQGRLTISPFAHIDPWGLLMLVLFKFGYGRPVQINPRNFRKQRGGEILVALAGVTVNLAIAFLSFALLKLLLTAFHIAYSSTIFAIVFYTGMININLLIFNLLPIPPLDGYKVVRNLFIHKNINFFWKLDQYGFLILLVLLFTGVLTPILSAVSDFITSLMFGILAMPFRI